MVTKPENIGTVCPFCAVTSVALPDNPEIRCCPSCKRYSERGIQLPDGAFSPRESTSVEPGAHVYFLHQDYVHQGSAWAVGKVAACDPSKGKISLSGTRLLDRNLKVLASLPGIRHFYERRRITICHPRAVSVAV